MTAEAKLREVADDWVTNNIGLLSLKTSHGRDQALIASLTTLLASALEAARREVWLEAAEIAESIPLMGIWTPQSLAAELRAEASRAAIAPGEGDAK